MKNHVKTRPCIRGIFMLLIILSDPEIYGVQVGQVPVHHSEPEEHKNHQE